MAMLPRLDAERQLKAFEAASIPHMEDRDRSRAFRYWQDLAGGHAEKPKPATAADLAAIGIKVQHV